MCVTLVCARWALFCGAYAAHGAHGAQLLEKLSSRTIYFLAQKAELRTISFAVWPAAAKLILGSGAGGAAPKLPLWRRPGACAARARLGTG